MLRYLNAKEVFAEVPDEISLAISITGCQYRCPECNQKELWQNIGEPLNLEVLERLLEKFNGITCVCFLGGDNDTDLLYQLADFVKSRGLKTCWYSGRTDVDNFTEVSHFDYIKVGRYNSKYGPLNSPTTNQIMYHRKDGTLINITHKFWQNEIKD